METPSSGFTRSRCLVLAALAGTLCATGAARAQTVSQWLTATSGNWTDAARWSTNPFYPTNGNGNPTYRAEILATGSNYTITLNTDVALASLLLGSANATIAHTAGTLTLTGTATLSAGTFNLNGGTIRGGTIDNTGNHLAISSSASNTLDGTALVGNLALNASNNLRLKNGFSTTGTVSLTASGASLVFDNTQTFSSGVLAFTQSFGSASVAIDGDSTLTLGAGAEIRGKSATIGSQRYTTGTNALVNNGLINANTGGGILTLAASSTTNNGTMRAAGGVINVSSASFVNTGTVEALTGSVNFLAPGARRNDGTMSLGAGTAMTLGGDWSRLGTINQTGGTLTMAGTYDTSTGFTLNRSGGALNFSGIMNNTGGALSFTTAGGPWAVDSGRINYGSVTFTGAGDGMSLSGNSGRFYGLTYNGNLSSTGNFAHQELREGFTLNGTWTLSGRGSNALFVESQTVGGNAVFAFTGVDDAQRGLGANSGSMVTLGSGVVIRGENGVITGNPGGGWINHGRLSADVSGQSIELNVISSTYQNLGTIEAINGGLLVIHGSSGGVQSFFSSGTIRAGAGSTMRFDATRVVLAGSTLVNNGTILINAGSVLDNTGSTIDFGALGGSWVFDQSRIQGGTVLATAGLVNANTLTLDGVNFTGALSGNVYANNSSIAGTVTLDAGKAFTAGGVLSTNAAYTLNGGRMDLSGQISLGAGFSVTSTGGQVNLLAAQLDNAGKTLDLNAASGSWSMDLNSRVLGGTVRLRDGATFTGSGMFDGVTLDGVLAINTVQAQRPAFFNGVTGGEIRVNAAGAGVIISGIQTLSGTTLRFAGTNQAASFSNIENTPVELAVDSAIRATGGGQGALTGFATLSNYGEIAADGAGSSISSALDVRIENQGRLRATNGGSLTIQRTGALTGDLAASGAGSAITIAGGTYTLNGPTSITGGASLTLGGTWTNGATLTLDASTLNAGGAFATSAFGTIAATGGSTVRVTGQCDNTGATLGFSGADLHLSGGRITGGTISGATPVVAEGAASVLDGVTVNSALSVQGARLDAISTTLNGATTITGGGVMYLAGTWANLGGITVDNSTLNVGGAVNLANLGTITRVGASSVNLSGTLDATGQTVTWTNSGPFSSINGGSVTAHRVDVQPGVVLAMNGGGLNTPIIGGGGTVRVTGADAYLANGEVGAGLLTVESGTVVEATGSGRAWFTPYNPAPGNGTVNDGTIRTSGSAGVYVGGDTFVNHGLVEAGGGEVNIGFGAGQNNPTWSNTGEMRASNGAYLFLRGTTTTAGLGTIRQTTGGTVVLDGIVDNTGSTLTIGAGAVEAMLGEHARVTGGTMASVSGSRIFASGRLTDVHVVGDIDVNELTLASGTTVTGGLYLTNFASLFVNGSVALDGTSVNFSGVGGFTEVSLANHTSLTLGSGSLMHGGNAFLRITAGGEYANDVTLINEGVIRADIAGQRLDLSPRRLTNTGTLEATNGGVLSVGSTGNGPLEWSNAGLIRAGAGSTVEMFGILTLLSGSVLDGTAGAVKLRGTLDNSSSTLALDNSTGSLVLNGGRIKGGTVTTAGAAELTVERHATFENTAVVGSIRVGDTSNMFLRGGFAQTGVTHLSGSGSALIMAGDGELTSGTVAFESTGARSRILAESNGPSTAVIGAGATIRGGNGILVTNAASTIINRGLISADVSGLSIQINLTRFFNEGTMQAINGGILDLLPPGGAGGGLGSVLVNTGVVSLGMGSRMDLNGDLVLGSTGSLEMAFGMQDFHAETARITSAGELELGGRLLVAFSPDIGLREGDSVDLFDARAVRGGFETLILPTLSGDLAWDVSGLTWSGVIRVVPTPASLLVLAVMIPACGRRTRKGGAL